MSKFVVAVNCRGEKVVVPKHWLTHPRFSREFRYPPSYLARRRLELAASVQPESNLGG